jgi:predicted DNA-binding transcriptional regulator YafY
MDEGGGILKDITKAERLLNTLYTIQLYPGIKARKVADMIGVQPRSIQRYVKELRQLGFDVDSSTGAAGGFVLKGTQQLKPLAFSGPEAMALFVAARVLLQKEGFPFQENLQTALQKISSAISQNDREFFVGLEPRISLLVDQIKDYFPWQEAFCHINEAILSQRVLKVSYYSFSRNATGERELEPYHVLFKDGAWYLIAYCRSRQSIRLFRVDRIQSIELTAATYRQPQDFDIKKYMHHSWQVAKGEKVQVVVRFFPPISRLIKEGTFHRTQSIEELPDENVLFKVVVEGTWEIKKWILGWGKFAEIISPEALRSEVSLELSAAGALYSS